MFVEKLFHYSNFPKHLAPSQLVSLLCWPAARPEQVLADLPYLAANRINPKGREQLFFPVLLRTRTNFDSRGDQASMSVDNHRDATRKASPMEIEKIMDLPPTPGLDGRESADYWYGLITETEAAVFRGQKPGTLRKRRHTGDGPKYIALSARCIRYRRIDLLLDQQQRMRNSTAEVAGDEQGSL